MIYNICEQLIRPWSDVVKQRVGGTVRRATSKNFPKMLYFQPVRETLTSHLNVTLKASPYLNFDKRLRVDYS